MRWKNVTEHQRRGDPPVEVERVLDLHSVHEGEMPLAEDHVAADVDGAPITQIGEHALGAFAIRAVNDEIGV